jgi:hypothetical protein
MFIRRVKNCNLPAEVLRPFVEGGSFNGPLFLKYPLRGMKLMKKYHRGWGDLQLLVQYAAGVKVYCKPTAEVPHLHF